MTPIITPKWYIIGNFHLIKKKYIKKIFFMRVVSQSRDHIYQIANILI